MEATRDAGGLLLHRISFITGVAMVTACLSASVARAQSCISGPVLSGALAGAVGSAPADPFVEITCLEIRDDSGSVRSGEVAFAGIPLPHTLGLTDTGGLAVIGPGNQRHAAQFDVLSRWAGTVDDTSKPIRWLQVSVAAEVPANATVFYSLRHYPSLPAAADPFTASITAQDKDWQVDTGLATFVVDPANPALLESIDIDLDDDGTGAKTTVYAHTVGAGPRLVYDSGSGDVTLDTGTPGEVTVDSDGFEILESGPVKVVVALRGHFVDPGGTSLCTAAAESYEALGFTAILTFLRGSRDIRMQLQLRNECSDALTGPWTDDAVLLREAAWRFPFTLTNQVTFVGGNGPVSASAVGFAGITEVEQRRGTGTAPLFEDWARRARTRRDAVDLETAEFFTDPLLAVSDDPSLPSPTLTVAAQMPWMGYREPQALRVEGTTLSLRFVSDDLRVGEGKGLWNFARVHLVPTALATSGQSLGTYLEGHRAGGRVELERGLLVWAPRGFVSAAKVFPSLGTGAAHTARTHYLEWMTLLHGETVDPGGQWDRNKTFGSQYWPETGSNDPFGVDADFPNQSTAGMNYWDPAGAELFEFLGSGDPEWAWDFSLMGYWSQAFAAYLNTGFNFSGNRNGLAVEAGGPGCPVAFSPPFVEACTADGTGGGHWQRTAGGSDDYTYAMAMELGYVLRPNPALRDRFAQAGQTVVDRYDPAIPETDRETFVNTLNFTRQVIQHFEMLANCAEFVPGARGQACQGRLLGVLAELARDNLAAGILCQGQQRAVRIPTGCEPVNPPACIEVVTDEIFGPPKALPTQCFTPQQFMQNALMYQFLHRIWSNYRHAADAGAQTTMQAVRRALVESSRVLHDEILEQNGGSLVVLGNWPAALDCTLNGSGTAVMDCDPAQDSDGNFFMFLHNQPHTAALLLMAHDLDPSLGYCAEVKSAYDNPDLTGGLGDNGGFDQVGHFNLAGWWKGVAQMMQSMAWGVGLYDVCVDDPTSDLAVTKTNHQDSVAAGASVTWEIEVTNNGPHDVMGATLTDVLDSSIVDLAAAGFTCAPVGNAGDGTVCPLSGDAAVLAAGVSLDLESGDTMRFTLHADLLASANGTLVNTATVSVPATTADGTPGNDSATDSDPVGICTGNADEVVSGTITDTQVIEACNSIIADAMVAAGADLTLHAPLVRLADAFTVEAGGSLTIIGGLPVE